MVAFIGEQAVGRAMLTWRTPHSVRHITGAIPFLSNLYVDEVWRNLGIGTKIIGSAEDKVKSRPATIPAIALMVQIKNVDAQRLYERLGYDYLTADDGSDVFTSSWRQEVSPGQWLNVSDDFFAMHKLLEDRAQWH